MSSADCLVCWNFQSASKSFRVGQNIVRASNSLDLGEAQSYSMSHPDPSCFHIGLLVAISTLGRVLLTTVKCAIIRGHVGISDILELLQASNFVWIRNEGTLNIPWKTCMFRIIAARITTVICFLVSIVMVWCCGSCWPGRRPTKELTPWESPTEWPSTSSRYLYLLPAQNCSPKSCLVRIGNSKSDMAIHQFCNFSCTITPLNAG